MKREKKPFPKWEDVLADMRRIRDAIDRALPAIEFLAEWDKARAEQAKGRIATPSAPKEAG